MFAVLFVAGCDARVDDRLVIATSLPASEAAKVEAEFTKWLDAKAASAVSARTSGIHWIWLDRGDDVESFARSRRGVDVLLGGPIESFQRLESSGLLDPLEPAAKSKWLAIELPEAAPIKADGPTGPLPASKLVDLAQEEFAKGPWTSGYERLILGRANATSEKPAADVLMARDGAAILSSSSRREAALALASFLVETRAAKPGEPATEVALVEDGILGDLLQATLVDSAEELAGACHALADLSDPSQSRRWMCEPPPWPPASVAKIQTRNGEQAMTMIETLASQVAPDPRLASWLLRSWLTPARVVDGDLIARLARAEQGRLAREPRFRAWLRAEWTAWARQRYRRVARQARSGLPVADAKAPSATPVKETNTQ